MSVVDTDRAMYSAGLGRTLRTLRDPLLLFAAPVTFGVCPAVLGYGQSWPIGYDSRVTLSEPARVPPGDVTPVAWTRATATLSPGPQSGRWLSSSFSPSHSAADRGTSRGHG